MSNRSLDVERGKQFAAITVFGAFTGQRVYSTIKELRVEQFREALKLDKPVLLVELSQDKIRMEHYVPLHPQVASTMKSLCDGKDGSKLALKLESFRK